MEHLAEHDVVAFICFVRPPEPFVLFEVVVETFVEEHVERVVIDVELPFTVVLLDGGDDEVVDRF